MDKLQKAIPASLPHRGLCLNVRSSAFRRPGPPKGGTPNLETKQSAADPRKPLKRSRRLSLPLLALAAALVCGSSAQAQFGHLNAGAVSQDAGVPLLWVNGAIFATNSGYSQLMPISVSGTYAGYYNSGPTMTALPTSDANDSGGPSPYAALQGAFINVQLTLFSAPAGATFSFWETGQVVPTYVLGVGDTTPLIALSDAALGAGNAGADPYGHIHGRRFTATAAGDYIVGLQLIDTSEFGPGATPLHTPSDTLFMRFTAEIPEPASASVAALGLIAWRFRSRSKPASV
jgi:hypothetical protein